MEKQEKIVDASVILKWFLNEEDSEKAIIIKNKHIQKDILLIVPDLLFLEVANTLKYKKDNFEKIKNANKDLWNFQFVIQKIDESILEKAIEISLKYNFTMYDSIYIALAQIYNTELITADEELVRAPNVKLLNDMNI
jgi:predicted nucleic acid-binding protein